MKYLAVIPARAGSKGLPNKNIANLAGKPLIAWSIEQALSTPSIDTVCVSTDCEKIANISKKYGKYPNVIYEVWNEPLKISWDDEIRPYMLEIIRTIRSNDKDNIILLGTPYWCQRVDEAFKNPIKEKNIMYTAHFYTGTHKDELRNNLEELWKAGCPIFISEFGVSIYDGGTLDRNVYLEEADLWIDWMEKRKISWLTWSLCDKDESSALLSPGASETGNWKEEELSKAGKYIKNKINSN